MHASMYTNMLCRIYMKSMQVVQMCPILLKISKAEEEVYDRLLKKNMH